MASILKFRHDAVSRVRRTRERALVAASVQNAGEIVIFPGIRYERWDDDVDRLQSDHAGTSVARRDRLDVGE